MAEKKRPQTALGRIKQYSEISPIVHPAEMYYRNDAPRKHRFFHRVCFHKNFYTMQGLV